MSAIARRDPMIGKFDWLTAGRARAYAAPVWVLGLVLTFGMVSRIVSPAMTDMRHRIAPTDFSAFWAAARLAALGDPQAAYDPQAAQAAQCQEAACDPAAPFPRPYLYPPAFLLFTLPFGLLPLPFALVVFVAAGYGLAACCLRRLAGHGWWLPILLSPGALLNAVTGQAGCLSASCLAGGLLLVGTRPALAGVCLGLLVFKPQLALAIPVVLLAGRRWRALAACGATAFAVCALSWCALGQAAWTAFFARSSWAGSLLREEAVWHRLVSVYGAARLLRAGVPLAAACQGLAAILALGYLIWLARQRLSDGGDVAAITPAALLCTPYLWDYDLVCLSVPAAWLAGRAAHSGWRRWEKPMLCGSYMVPVLARYANLSLGVPLSPFLAAGLLVLVGMRSTAPQT